jgi:hypothetical protein
LPKRGGECKLTTLKLLLADEPELVDEILEEALKNRAVQSFT